MVEGLAGGLVMTAAMTMGSKAGVIEETLPQKLEQKFEMMTGVAEATDPTRATTGPGSGRSSASGSTR